MNVAKASAKRIELAKRRQLALELRKGGATYRQIADAIRVEYKLSRYACGLAYRDVMMALRELKANNRERAQDLLDLELARLDELTGAVYQKAIGGELASVDTLLRIMDRRATYLKLLLPAPVIRTEISGPDGGPMPITEIVIERPAAKPLPTKDGEDGQDVGDGDGDGAGHGAEHTSTLEA